MKYAQHPLSAAFPVMAAEDFQALKDSITEIGVQNPITVFEGMVIDGWHRYTAANELGMDCPVVELGDVDPRDFVLAQNKARRHVTQAQLALATTAVYSWKPLGANQHGGSAGPAEAPKTTKELAAIAGVGVRSIEQAKVIQTKAVPEVVEAVKRGEIGGEKAAAIAKLPKEQQAAAIKKPMAAIHPEDEDVGAPSAEEIAYLLEQQQSDQKAMDIILESNGDLAALKAEYDRQSLELATVKGQRDEYMNKCNELVSRIKTLRRKLDKLEKQQAVEA